MTMTPPFDCAQNGHPIVDADCCPCGTRVRHVTSTATNAIDTARWDLYRRDRGWQQRQKATRP